MAVPAARIVPRMSVPPCRMWAMLACAPRRAEGIYGPLRPKLVARRITLVRRVVGPGTYFQSRKMEIARPRGARTGGGGSWAKRERKWERELFFYFPGQQSFQSRRRSGEARKQASLTLDTSRDGSRASGASQNTRNQSPHSVARRRPEPTGGGETGSDR